MGDRSGIEWTDATWNPITGCSKVSPGCAHCYAETLALTRMAGSPGYPSLPWTPENAAANVMLRPDRLDQPLRWRRPRRIFVNSMSDLFHELVPDDYIDQVFNVMASSYVSDRTTHTFQVLTKRPERMRAYLAAPGRREQVATAYQWFEEQDHVEDAIRFERGAWPLPNVWLGTSVENQHWADVRVPELLATPAAVRFLSCEPLLAPVSLSEWIARADVTDDRLDAPDGAVVDGRERVLDTWEPLGLLHWVIAGGESGPVHRPMQADWVRTLRDQCTDAGVAFLFKQWGGRTSKAGGRELDGRTWDEYPQAAA